MSRRILAALAASVPADDPIVELGDELTVGHIRRALARFDWRPLGIPRRPGPLGWMIVAVMMRTEEPMAEA